MEGLIKIDIVTRPSKLEVLKNALKDIGINGMTVSHVLGCGQQKGKTEYYRGIEYEIDLLPKIKVELAICTDELSLECVLKTVKDTLRTGQIGDGKIFVYPIQKVIKIRTNEEDLHALHEKKD